MIRRALAILLLFAASVSLTGCDVQQSIAVRKDVAGANPTLAPEITGGEVSPTGGHTTFDLNAEKGKVVVIEFWGSWCGPCRQEQPDLNALVQRYGGKPVVFIGVAMRDSADSVRAYQSGLNVTYPSVMDSDESISGNYNVASPPTTVVVDTQGHVSQRFLGTTVGISDEIDQLLS